jgi:hypothetical protein
VVANQSALLVSATGDPVAPIRAESITGGISVWATAAQVDHHGVTDLDALEVWGGELLDDSTRFSLEGDPTFVAVWAYDSGLDTSVPLITSGQIAAAIGQPNLLPQIDLDALMMGGEQLLFSIRPIDGFFDGGEIWSWDGIGLAAFLSHGGHLWDTANDVTVLLGAENVDALEAVSAVPEPSSLSLTLFAALGALALRRRN